MKQDELFHETLNDALVDTVKAVGGFKSVGHDLWPEKTVREAEQRLRDCLNPDRRDRLTPEQALWLIRKGREAGYHAAARFICLEAGYAPPQPVEPEDQKAVLQRQYIEATKTLARLVQRIDSMEIKK
ncbi:MAG: hypothetical protein FWC38_00815 [Proteobacteria bacterium]|nr:hypothetical protein [Pseudomonadota bacterium]MCL2306784.1 hypothetical protein [Pseudomonadota bacterium]